SGVRRHRLIGAMLIGALAMGYLNTPPAAHACVAPIGSHSTACVPATGPWVSSPDADGSFGDYPPGPHDPPHGLGGLECTRNPDGGQPTSDNSDETPDEGASGANGVLECTNGGQPADPEIGPAQPTDLEGSPAQPNSHESGQNCSTLA